MYLSAVDSETNVVEVTESTDMRTVVERIVKAGVFLGASPIQATMIRVNSYRRWVLLMELMSPPYCFDDDRLAAVMLDPGCYLDDRAQDIRAAAFARRSN